MSRLEPKVRKEEILDAALTLSEKFGYNTITRGQIAKHAGVSDGLVSSYWGTMKQIRRSIMRQAVAREVVAIVAQGISAGDKDALKASSELKTKVAVFLCR